VFKAILFDLDGTLLDIDMNIFLQHYFKSMADMAEELGYAESEKLVKQVFKSTHVMISNRDPSRSNEEVFMKDFFNNWDYPPWVFMKFFDTFYDTRFPALNRYCRLIPGVPDMMARLFKKGIKIVIATNPVYPLKAIYYRLKWAGVSKFPYALVTSYENMHFCKPHIEYYEEIVDRIGVKPADCLMVGNDVGEDIIAGQIGMKTFLVEDMLIDKGFDLKPDWRGSIKDLFKFTEQI
jgi:FMN phosphatase YigB (HAD superfamily)